MKTKERRRAAGDWRSIENEKEKYAAYLCSREWSELKEAVKIRSNGTCERCRVLPGDAVHHLTYERKYNEHPDDLQHICNACHQFTHAKSDLDPCAHRRWIRYLQACKAANNWPVPDTVAEFGLATESFYPAKDSSFEIVARMMVVKHLHDEYERFSAVGSINERDNSAESFDSAIAIEFERASIEIESLIPFAFGLWLRYSAPTIDHVFYSLSLDLFSPWMRRPDRIDPETKKTVWTF